MLTETVFAIPGMGSWLKEAIFNRDYPALQGGILFLAFVSCIVNLLVDICYGLINPQIRVELMSIAEVHEIEVLGEHVPSGLWREAWRRLRRNPVAIIGASFVASSSSWRSSRRCSRPTTHRAESGAARQRMLPRPVVGSPMGVDELGRDELSRLMYGARYSLVIGIVSVAVGLSLGMLLGAIAGGFGGFTDSVAMRGMDIMLAIPGFLLALGIVVLMGPASSR